MPKAGVGRSPFQSVSIRLHRCPSDSQTRTCLYTLHMRLACCVPVDEQQSQAGAVVNPEVFYMKQTISNACGTIGVLHAIGNNLEAAGLSTPPPPHPPFTHLQVSI